MRDHGIHLDSASYYREGEKFASIVREMRTEKAWNQAELAKQVQGSDSTIRRLEQNTDGRGGIFFPNPKLVAALCLALGDSVDDNKQLLYSAFPYLPYLLDADLYSALLGDVMQKNEILAGLCGTVVCGALQKEKKEK